MLRQLLVLALIGRMRRNAVRLTYGCHCTILMPTIIQVCSAVAPAVIEEAVVSLYVLRDPDRRLRDLRIYVSSTYRDLAPYERAVEQSLSSLASGTGFQVIHVTEADQDRNEDVTRFDAWRIQDIDLFILLVAWRYGHIPEGETRSVTHLEYEEAKKQEKLCLVFLADSSTEALRSADSPFPEASRDEGHLQQIHAFREELERQESVHYFATPDELSRELADVLAPLHREIVGTIVAAQVQEAEQAAEAGNLALARQDLELAWGLVETPGDRDLVAASLVRLADLELRSGDVYRAADHLEQALALAEPSNNPGIVGTALLRLGELELQSGNMSRAAALLERALQALRAAGDRREQGIALTSLGNIAFESSRYEEAEQYFQQALAIDREVGSRADERIDLRALGALALARGEVRQAADYFSHVLEIGRELGDVRAQRDALALLAQTKEAEGQLQEAQELAEEALRTTRLLQDRGEENHALVQLGDIAMRRGRVDEAELYYREALSIARELGSEGRVARNLDRLARAVERQGRPEEAIQYYQEALHILGGLGETETAAALQAHLTSLARAQEPNAPSHSGGNQPAGSTVHSESSPSDSDGHSQPERVTCSLQYPKEVVGDAWYTVVASLSLSTPEALSRVDLDVAQRLGDHKGEYRPVSGPGAKPLRRNTTLTLVPRLPGFTFNPPHLTVTWAEDVQHHEFRMRVTTARAAESVNGHFQVWLGPLLFAELPMSIYVRHKSQWDSPKHPDSSDVRIASAALFRRIFASYCHKDSEIVRLCEAAVEATGDRYLIDVRLLRSGERWDERLMKAIDEADLFQLFWSKAAAISPYVEQEWRHALKLYQAGRRRSEFIRPVYWSRRLPPIPRELDDERIHFDRLDLEKLGWVPRRHFWNRL